MPLLASPMTGIESYQELLKVTWTSRCLGLTTLPALSGGGARPPPNGCGAVGFRASPSLALRPF